MNLDLLVADLERDEGYRQFPYEDTAGKLTIGIGLNLTDVGLSREEALFILRDRINSILLRLDELVLGFSELSPDRQRALANMAYNMGVKRLLKFTDMLTALYEHRYDDAAAAALDSVWARQVGDRATRIANLIRSAE